MLRCVARAGEIGNRKESSFTVTERLVDVRQGIGKEDQGEGYFRMGKWIKK